MSTAIMEHNPQNNRFVLHCDFCGALSHEVKILISSPNGSHICDECVAVCVEALEERRKQCP